MKFLAYLYYRLFKYYKTESLLTRKIHIWIIISTLMAINLLSIILIIEKIKNIEALGLLLSDDYIKNKLVILVMMSPIFLFTLLLYKRKNNFLQYKLEEFEIMGDSEKKKLNISFWFYIIFSVIFLFASITSPLWLK